MKNLLLLSLFFTIFGCSLIEPACLIIQNDSEFTICVSLDKGNKSEVVLKQNESDFVLIYPTTVRICVYIESVNLYKDYSITLSYLEKKKFIFSTDEK